MTDIDIETRLKKKKMKRRLYILAFVLIIAAGVIYLLTRPEPLPVVRTAQAAQEKSLKQTLRVSAQVGPFAIQTVPAVNQSITKIPVEVGDRVKIGDVLMVLGKKSLEDDLQKATEAREEAEASLEEANTALAAAQAAAAYASDAQMSGILNQITANLQSSLTNTLAQLTGQLTSKLPTADDFSKMTAEQLEQWRTYLDELRADLDEWIERIPQATPTPSPTPTISPTPTLSPTPEPTVQPSPTPTISQIPIISPTPEPTVQPSLTPTISPTPSLSPTPEPTLQPSPTPTSTPSETSSSASETTSQDLRAQGYGVGSSGPAPVFAAADLSQFLSGSGMAGDTLNSTMAQGEALVEQLKEAEEQARKALENAKTTILAEVDGIVVNINAEVGEPETDSNSVTALGTTEAPAMLIYDDSSLIASFRANRYDAIRIEKGQAVNYSADNLAYFGEVIFKSPIATSGSGSNDLSTIAGVGSLASGMGSTDTSSLLTGEALVDVRMSLDGADLDQLIIGFPIDSEITLKEVRDVLAIPAEALSKENDIYYVYVLDDAGIVYKRQVEVGIQAEVYAEIISGLSSGEVVVLNPTGTIKDGIKVLRDA